MSQLIALARRCAVLLGLLVLAGTASAAPTNFFVPYAGSGNLVVFDPLTGSGGWVGSIAQTPPPDDPAPLSLVTVVLFQYDAATNLLSGSFEFTAAADLASTLYGTVSGSALDPDILTSGGQFSLDYQIVGGTGDFLRASGFGLAFLAYDPAGVFDNTSEIGVLAFTVPEPGSLGLAAAGLLGLAAVRRRGRR